MKQKDIKLLWGRAANRCSLCRTDLAFDVTACPATFPIGEQAHIVAEESDGPRGKSILTLEERNSYANLILLCPTCHTKIDKAVADFPVEVLHLKKAAHECWVMESLSPRGMRENLNAIGEAQEEQCVSAYRDVLAAIAVLRSAGEQLERDHDWNQAQQHEMYAPTIEAIKKAFDTIERRRFDIVPSFAESAKSVVEYWDRLTDIFWEHLYLHDIDPPLDTREAAMLSAIPDSYRVQVAPGYFKVSQ